MDSDRSIHLDQVSLAPLQAERPTSLDFAAVYETHAPMVWNYLRRHGVASADLEDVVHEVFVVVHRRLPEFDGSSPTAIRAWLCSIAFRVASDHRRRVRNRREVAPPEVEPAARGEGPEAELAEREARALLLGLLSRLPDEQRQVFVLHDIEEHSMPEIAEMLGTSMSTLYSRLRLARKRLARTIRQRRSPGAIP